MQPKGGDWTGASPQRRPFRKINGMRRSSLSVALFERGEKMEDRTGVEHCRPLFCARGSCPLSANAASLAVPSVFLCAGGEEGLPQRMAARKGRSQLFSPYRGPFRKAAAREGASSGREVARRELSAAGHGGDGLVFPVPLGRYGSLLSKGCGDAVKGEEACCPAPSPLRRGFTMRRRILLCPCRTLGERGASN